MRLQRKTRVGRRSLATVATTALLGSLSVDVTAETVRLGLPVACVPGKSCFIQHYVDIDPGPAARDYACGTATYNGHSGVDVRLLSMEVARRGVDVVAAADGIVARVREGVADAFVRETGKDAVAGRQCGNAVAVAHAGGLETLSCHLMAGTVAVKPGQKVRRGDTLGRIGSSGLSDFAHLHFTVRRDKLLVDPFTGRAFPADPTGAPAPPDMACDLTAATATPPTALWEPAVARSLGYRPVTILQVGFAAALPDWPSLERDHAAFAPVRAGARDLYIFARLLNTRAGDRFRFRMTGPAGVTLDKTSEAVTGSRQVMVSGSGLRSGRAVWPTGRYDGRVEVLRDGRVIATAEAAHQMD